MKAIYSFFFFAVLASCKQDSFIFRQERFSDFDKSKITNVLDWEVSLGSKKALENFSPGMESVAYPNRNNLTLVKPLAFISKTSDELELTTEYYCLSSDSSIKAIVYSWQRNNNSDLSTRPTPKDESILTEKFESLNKTLNKKIGIPKSKMGASGWGSKESQTIVQRVKDGLNADIYFLSDSIKCQLIFAIFRD